MNYNISGKLFIVYFMIESIFYVEIARPQIDCNYKDKILIKETLLYFQWKATIWSSYYRKKNKYIVIEDGKRITI